MACLHPYKRYWKDVLTGETRYCECPCGKCVNCLAAKQDEWSIRAIETCKASDFVIYDTLTFSNRKISLTDVSDLSEHPCTLRSGSLFLLRHYYPDLFLPIVHRDIITDWIKRARENYYLFYGKRPKWKYLIFEEYGPKTSRPHFHLLWFGCRMSDYKRFLSDPWRERFGFHRAYYFYKAARYKHPQDVSKDFSCITKYVSKYCSKGSFESPLVLDGLQPKPFRVISRGIGEEYLDSKFFRDFMTPTREAWREMGCYKRQFGPDLENMRRVTFDFHRYFDSISEVGEELHIQERDLTFLESYIDDAGYKHPLPRYYKDKILKLRTNNVFSTYIQMLLLQNARKRCYQKLQGFAAIIECPVPSEFRPTDQLEKLCDCGGRLLYERFTAFRKAQALAQAKRHFTVLKNHYNRAKIHKSTFVAQ